MFSHVVVSVTDFDRALAFYGPVMDGLGLELRFCERDKPWAGWHSEGRSRPFFVICKPHDGRPHDPGVSMTRQVPYPHPGDILAEESLKPMGITQYRLAKAIHVPVTRIAAIVSGERGVTTDTALRLSKAFGLSDSFWTNLQKDYETAIAKEELAEELATIELLEAA